MSQERNVMEIYNNNNNNTRLTAVFQDTILHFIGAKDDGGGGGNWSCKTCKAPVRRHHRHTSTQLFTDRMPFQSPNQQCRRTKGRTFNYKWKHVVTQLTAEISKDIDLGQGTDWNFESASHCWSQGRPYNVAVISAAVLLVLEFIFRFNSDKFVLCWCCFVNENNVMKTRR